MAWKRNEIRVTFSSPPGLIFRRLWDEVVSVALPETLFIDPVFFLLTGRPVFPPPQEGPNRAVSEEKKPIGRKSRWW